MLTRHLKPTHLYLGIGIVSHIRSTIYACCIYCVYGPFRTITRICDILAQSCNWCWFIWSFQFSTAERENEIALRHWKANAYIWAEREQATITALRQNISLCEGVQKAHSLLFERLNLMKIPQKTQISREWKFFQDTFHYHYLPSLLNMVWWFVTI